MFNYDDIDFPLVRSSLILLGGYFIVCGGLYLGRQLAQGAQGDYPTNPLAEKSRRLIGHGSMCVFLAWFAYHFINHWIVATQTFMFFGFYLANVGLYAKQRNEEAVLVTHGIACGLIFFAGFGLGPAASLFVVLALLTRIACWLWLQPKLVEPSRV